MAGVVLTFVGIIAGVLATRHWGERRARLLFTYRTVPLLSSTDSGGLLKVTYLDHEVQDPQLVTLLLRNTGPRDIASGRFDSGKPLHINLNAKMYGVVASSAEAMRGSISESPVGNDNGYIEFEPALLRRAQAWSAEVLVSGSPEPRLNSPLVDTDVVEAEEGSTSATKEFASVAASALSASVGFGGIASAFAGSLSRAIR